MANHFRGNSGVTFEEVGNPDMAPHRYHYDTFDTGFRYLTDDYRVWKAAVPYKEGECIWIERDGAACRARIVHILHDRSYRERTGDRREVYRCQYETKAGKWSRNWTDAHPGTVQRGYQRAGLAPDVDRWEPLPEARAVAAEARKVAS